MSLCVLVCGCAGVCVGVLVCVRGCGGGCAGVCVGGGRGVCGYLFCGTWSERRVVGTVLVRGVL